MSDGHSRPYNDPSLPVPVRVADLLSRMTLVEKIGQLCMVSANDPWVVPKREKTVGSDAKLIKEFHVGSFLNVIGNHSNKLQEIALQETRLGIPVWCGIDAVHGHALWPGTTVFPSHLAMSCTWEPNLLESCGRVTARELRATGVHWDFDPVLCMGRDTRWGRIHETFGEDPLVIGEMATAMIQGYQNRGDLGNGQSVLACAKHFVAYAESQGGRDSSEVDVSRRKLMTYFLPPFRKAIVEGKCKTVMTGYQCIDGTPCTANSWLLNDILKRNWRFDGALITDFDNIGRMVTEQFVSESFEDATSMMLNSGNDMSMGRKKFCGWAKACVDSGLVSEVDRIDEACARVLRLKFEQGLFDKHRFYVEETKEVIACDEHLKTCLELTRRSVVLLKNEGNTLPINLETLGRKHGRIAVIGPNANDKRAQLGEWTAGGRWAPEECHPDKNIISVLDGVRTLGQKNNFEVVYEKGCAVLDSKDDDIPRALQAASSSDIIVAVLGDDAELNGEMHDRADLNLTGKQEDLLKGLYQISQANHVPIVLVLVCGKPLTIPWAVDHIPAILTGFNSGMFGGQAIAEVMFGVTNPSGKLTISWPRHVGQLPVFYNQVPGWHATNYVDMTADPQFRFGHGLSYSNFQYSDVALQKSDLSGDLKEDLVLTVSVSNSGSTAGREVVQVYVTDQVSSVSIPRLQLKAFQSVSLEAGSSEVISIKVPFHRLALVNASCEYVVEPGVFDVYVGGSSDVSGCMKATFRVSTTFNKPVLVATLL